MSNKGIKSLLIIVLLVALAIGIGLWTNSTKGTVNSAQSTLPDSSYLNSAPQYEFNGQVSANSGGSYEITVTYNATVRRIETPTIRAVVADTKNVLEVGKTYGFKAVRDPKANRFIIIQVKYPAPQYD